MHYSFILYINDPFSRPFDVLIVWAKQIRLFPINSDQAQTFRASRSLMKEVHTPSFSFPRANGPEKRWGENRGISVRNPFWATKAGYLLTSPRHTASDRVVEAHRTFQDYILGALSSSMVLRKTVRILGWCCCCTVFTQVIFLGMAEKRLNPSSVPRSLDG